MKVFSMKRGAINIMGIEANNTTRLTSQSIFKVVDHLIGVFSSSIYVTLNH